MRWYPLIRGLLSKTPLTISYVTYMKTIMNGKQIRIWKEAVVAYIKVLS